jgi:hypothetical protein
MNITADKYISDVLPVLVDFRYQSMRGGHILMQDGAPAHTEDHRLDECLQKARYNPSQRRVTISKPRFERDREPVECYSERG